MFIDQNYAKNFDINYLDKLVKAYNVDGTENKQGTINAYVNLEFSLGKRKFKERFYVTRLGKQRIILGFPWLHKYNPIIDWKKGEVTFKPFRIDWRRLMEKGKRIRMEQQPKVEEVVDDEEQKNRTTLPIVEDKLGVYIELLETDVWICKTNVATELAIEENSRKQDKTDEQLVPVEYHEYLDIFSKEKAHCFPESRPWDHKIEMKEGFEPKLFKNYNLTPAEQLELDKFLKENLEKHPAISITNGFPILLRFQERWKTLTMSGLPVLKRLDGQKFLSTTTYFGDYGQTQRRKVLHQTGHVLGLQ
jgi:hypothetical protein